MAPLHQKGSSAMEIFEFEAGRSFDRRIGRRAVTPPIDVSWVVPATGLLRNMRERPGHIEEISLTGAAIIGPATLKVKVGDTVLVRFAGGDSSVIIRRIDPVEDDRARFAVELVVVHPVLERQLMGALSLPDDGHTGSTRFAAASGAGVPSAAMGYDPLAAADAGAASSGAPPEAEVEAARPLKGPMTSAADADEVRDLVDELRRFMDDD